MTIFSSEFLQPVCSFPLLSEKNNGKRGERVMVDRKSNFWVSSHLTPGHSARVCYSPGTNVNTPIRITLLPRCLSGHWAPDSVHIFCQFEGNLLAFHTYNLLLLLHLKMILLNYVIWSKYVHRTPKVCTQHWYPDKCSGTKCE